MDMFDLEFYELSMIADDPKKLAQLKEHYYDPEFDEWLEEFDVEQSEKSSGDQNSEDSEDLDLPDKETITWAEKTRSEDTSVQIPSEEYELPVSTEIEDWEEVED